MATIASIIQDRRQEAGDAALAHIFSCSICHPDNPAGERCEEGRRLLGRVLVWVKAAQELEVEA